MTPKKSPILMSEIKVIGNSIENNGTGVKDIGNSRHIVAGTG